MVQAAKFPAALAAIADFFGEHPNQPANELILLTTIDADDLSIVATTAIPASWPAFGRMIIDGEVIEYASYAGSTFTISAVGKRGLETAFGSGAAAAHTAGAVIGNWVTAQAIAQMVAEIIALETQSLGGIHNDNKVLNSDFSRRTVFGLAMPEVFADLSGTTKIDGGAAGSVAANIFTQGAANNEYAWCAGSFVWRDGRASATFKAVSAAGTYALRWRIDANNWVEIGQNTGGANSVEMRKRIGGAETQVTVTANTLTVNRWYWLEIEKQGTKWMMRVYDTGGTASGVTKASSTLIAATALAVDITDAGVLTGAHISITSDQATAQWGGIATGNGGVYVETWLPESWPVTFAGTLGGQAVGYDEAADAGPFGKQWALRSYIPAASRTATATFNGQAGAIVNSTSYTHSTYMKVSGLGGSGSLIEEDYRFRDSAAGLLTASGLIDAGVTTWTRKTQAAPAGATAVRADIAILFNPSSTATGTGYVMLPQLEQGSAATAWRNAPADDAPIVWQKTYELVNIATSSGSRVEIEPRGLGTNIFLPWDAVVRVTLCIAHRNSGAGNYNAFSFRVDGTDSSYTPDTLSTANADNMFTRTYPISLAAGKHRITPTWFVSAGTGTIPAATFSDPAVIIEATRGK